MTTEEKKDRAQLRELSRIVGVFLRAMDVLMARPATEKRGKDIATLLNALESQNDSVRYFSLGVNFRKDRKESITDSQVDGMIADIRAQQERLQL